MIQLTDNVFAIEVPDNAEQLEISRQNDGIPCLTYYSGQNIDPAVICLPVGSWRYLFKTKDHTEENAKQVVKELPVGCRYMNYNGDYPIWYHTAKESFKSLLLAKGLDQNKKYAVLKNVPMSVTDILEKHCFSMNDLYLDDQGREFKKRIIAAMKEYAAAAQADKTKKLTDALNFIRQWQLPAIGRFWDKEEKQPMSFEAAYGSNGARDYMRNVANQALIEWEVGNESA